MNNIQLVDAQNMQNIEQYAAACISSVASLKTLEGFQISAFKAGLLDEDEAETTKTICWEIHRLMSLYQTQIKSVLERTKLSEEEVLDCLRELMPKMTVAREQKNKKTTQ